MFNNDRTIENFGYPVDSLSNGSHKKIILNCDYCGIEYSAQKKNVMQGRKIYEGIGLTKDCCKKCSTLKTRESYDILGIAKKKKSEKLDKMKKTMLSKYGSDHFSKTDEFKDKVSDTWDNKTEEQLSLKRERQKTTLIKKYGERYWEKATKIREKTNLERYGVKDSSALPEFVKKREKTMMDRYGVSNFSNHEDCKISDWLLNEFGLIFSPNASILSGGKEIDLFNEELSVGIEYCGLYWHSMNPALKNNRDKNYHYNKYKECSEKSIRLFTIFEDEWINRKNQVKSFLRSALNKNECKFFARKCEVKSISKRDACIFFEKYHIQGANTIGRYFAGLFYENDLVAAMSFAKHHRNFDIMVLDRLCFKENVSIIGGASKLFNFLLKTTLAKSITSWSDNRWSVGNVYSALGFKLCEDGAPDYSYFASKSRPVKRVSKQSQKKSNTGCPKEIKEKDWCEINGYYQIWDCGKKRWLYESI
jgi:hypothetical protein